MKNLIIFAILCLIVLPIHAKEYHEHYYNDIIEIEIISNSGQEFPQYTVENNDNNYRAYVLAKKGQEYSVYIRNRTSKRIGLVIAVDGRNIISGQKSYLKNNERMYVLNAHQSGKYEGWRTDKNYVNEFYFTDSDQSYAGKWGDYSAMGVIAVAVYYEKYSYKEDDSFYNYEEPYKKYYGETEKSYRGSETMDNSSTFGYMKPAPGTGFGDEAYAPSRKVKFEAQSYPAKKYFLKYEWRSTLCEKGIIDCYGGHHEEDNRFWKEDNYAPYPPNYYK